MIDLTAHTAGMIAAAVRRRELTAVAVTQAALERIATAQRHAPCLHHSDARPSPRRGP